jgi:hypothetical protein
MTPRSDLMTPRTEGAMELGAALDLNGHARSRSIDKIPLLSDISGGATGIDGGAKDVARERKVGDLPS